MTPAREPERPGPGPLHEERAGASLVEALCDPSPYDHPVHGLELVETHISWVLLTGKFAYKIKKPVSLPFLDFSTLERRRAMCHEELRLNRRLAPDLYLKVVPITGSVARPVVDGPGAAIEYAVKMVQFDTANELDVLVHAGLAQELIDQLAREVADFHLARTSTCRDRKYGTPAQVRRRIMDNFAILRPHLDRPATARLDRLEDFVRERLAALEDTMDARIAGGYVRECHGDLHLGNMVVIDNRVRLFDCLEFNAQMRWIDVMSEVAFVVMDLEHHGCGGQGVRFLNVYLAATGDYAGLEVLILYLVYRAMVRAKVACIRDLQSPGASALTTEVNDYLELALRYTLPRRPRLAITHGFSGSGKSWWSERLAPGFAAIHIRSDVERDRVVRASAETPGEFDRYSPDNIALTYDHLRRLARSILQAGFSVIADATFLLAGQRRMFRELAEEIGVPFTIVDLPCDEELLQARIEGRRRAGGDPSEATIAVLEHQMRSADPLSEDERSLTVSVDAQGGTTVKSVLARISGIS